MVLEYVGAKYTQQQKSWERYTLRSKYSLTFLIFLENFDSKKLGLPEL